MDCHTAQIKWNIDNECSKVGFSVTQMKISKPKKVISKFIGDKLISKSEIDFINAIIALRRCE